MLEITAALQHVRSSSRRLSAQPTPAQSAVGQVLASDVPADIDSPPHNKALVDGFAVRVADQGAPLQLLEQVVAGSLPTQTLRPGTTSHVMTGAVLPVGTEAMVMVEHADVRSDDNGRAEFVHVQQPSEPGQHIMPQATCFAAGDVVLTAGQRIRPIEVGLACEVGHANLSCYPRPQVAILPTGDELVPADQQPGPGQIRNSNGPMLAAMVAAAGADPTLHSVGKDQAAQLSDQIQAGLESDVLILSGGVSAGVRDLVPGTLEKLGVQPVFHKVRLKPGKPLWFGYRDHGQRRTLVFGLPGNPVSSLVGFQLFVRPALQALAGHAFDVGWRTVRLAEPVTSRRGRPTLQPACLVDANSTDGLHDAGKRVRTLPWQGSADMLTIARADCLVHLPAGEQPLAADVELPALWLE